MSSKFVTKGVHPHNGKLRIHINYAVEPNTKATLHRASTGLTDTSENKIRAHFLREQIIDLIENNRFSSDQYCFLLLKNNLS